MENNILRITRKELLGMNEFSVLSKLVFEANRLGLEGFIIGEFRGGTDISDGDYVFHFIKKEEENESS
jgi:hypothetical protein